MTEAMQGPVEPQVPPIEALSKAVGAQARALDTIKQEVDALQIAEKHRHKPWYRDITSMVASLALLFSFGTTWVSFENASRQEQQAHRSDLRNLILQMGRLPREAFENQMRYADNQIAVREISALVNNENMILSIQASELANRIPDLVTASEHLALATALNNSLLYGRARNHIEKAKEKATNLAEITAAYRGLASNAAIQSDRDSARLHFQKAKDVLKEMPYAAEPAVLRDMSDVQTETMWSQTEAYWGDCAAAAEHLRRAKEHLEHMPASTRAHSAMQVSLAESAGCQPGSAPGVAPGPDTRIAAGSATSPEPPPGKIPMVPEWLRRFLNPAPQVGK